MRASTGASPAWACCSAAVNLKLCAGTTRSSWSPVSTSVAGYAVPSPDVVQRRVGQQHLEHLRVVGGAEVGDPRRADREQVEAQHVHHADRRQRHRGQVGPLGDRRADQQAAVAAAVQRELPVRRDALGDQVVGDRGEVVEDVLLALEPARVVPGGAVLAAAAQVRDRQHAAGREPARRTPAGSVASSGMSKPPYPHSSVGRGSSSGDVGAADQEVGHLGAVGAGRAAPLGDAPRAAVHVGVAGRLEPGRAPRRRRWPGRAGTPSRGRVTDDMPRNTSSSSTSPCSATTAPPGTSTVPSTVPSRA